MRPNLTYSAPVLPVDTPAEGWVIWPCPDCLPWHVELVRDVQTGEALAREWHAVDCPLLKELTKTMGAA